MPRERNSRPFSRQEIEKIPENLEGCFGLFRSDSWVYVGHGKLREHLIGFHDSSESKVMAEKPTHFVWIESPEPESMTRRLIDELHPICNGERLDKGGKS